MLDDLSRCRNAANVLDLHAREELANGNVASAMIDAASILRMGRQIGQRPLLISGIVGIGIGALGDKTLERTLPAVKSSEQLAALKLDELTPLDQILQESLRSEERFGLALYGQMPSVQTLQTLDDDRNEDTRLLSPRAGGPLGAFFRVFYLDSDSYIRTMAACQDLSGKPYFEARPRLAAVYAMRDNGMFTSMVLPALDRHFETCARIEAKDACAQAAVAMTRYRLDHGSLPKQLDDLVPTYLDAIPTDPFTGKPIRLVIKSDQWIIYSVGPEGRDHGGVEDKHGNADVIFTLK
jgi:hypothetical protein